MENNTGKMEIEREAVERIVVGALRTVILNHGDISKTKLASAGKAVSCSLMGHLKEITKRDMEAAVIEQLSKEYKDLQRQYKKMTEAHNALATKLGLVPNES